MTFWKKRREKLEQLEREEALVDAIREEVSRQTPRVNALVAWLEARKLSNGFGEDFEFTLAHPRSRSGG